MIKKNTLLDAYSYLQSIPRIENYNDHINYKGDVFFLSSNIDYSINSDSLIETFGLSAKLDKKIRDLVRIIEITDPLEIKYNCTNVLTPLTFAESRSDIPWHLNTQALLFTRANSDTIEWIKKTNISTKYDKHYHDRFWLPFCSDINEILNGECLSIFNRRVGGWDGSINRPVIELLGAGGHVPCVWNNNTDCFEMLPIKENIQKETSEELGIDIKEKDIKIFGGYKNSVTHELVVLSGVFIDPNMLPQMQEYAITNTDPDTMGIYLGRFKEVMDYYHTNPNPFAGGQKAANTNFPYQNKLMKRVYSFLENR